MWSVTLDPQLHVGRGGQLAEENQVCGLEEIALFRQLLDRVSAVEQHALVAVDVGDLAAAGGRVLERRVVCGQAEIVRRGLDLPEIHRPDRAVLDRNLVGLAGPVVLDRQRVSHIQSACSLSTCPRRHYLSRRRRAERVASDLIVAGQPLAQIAQPTAPAAERPPRGPRACVCSRRKPARPLPDSISRRVVYGRSSIARCRTSFADTMKMTSSAMLVAWSPMRSRCLDTRIRSSPGSIVEWSCSM